MNHPIRRQLKINPALWILFFCLLGFGLRVQRLNFQPLWGDEGWSIYFAAQSLPQLLALTAIDIHPPLYYLLLQGWLGLTGFGAETARFFSVVAGTALIPAVALLGRRLLGRRVSLVAAGIIAVMTNGGLLRPGSPHVRPGDSPRGAVHLFLYPQSI
ncbi:MAG: hypothetical protein HC875_11665 [Anaerolineales bacterium]|nr:hypothetical protein [Anaerolineales bacterium]